MMPIRAALPNNFIECTDALRLLSPEMRLFLSCCRVSGGEDARNLTAWLTGAPLDWPTFLALVDRHRVPALVYRNANRGFKDLIPSDIALQLTQRFETNRRNALSLAAEMVHVAGLLEAHGIPVVWLKGPALSLRLFGDLAMRHSRDLDPLVPAEYVHMAERLLLADGYERLWPDFALSPRQQKAFARTYAHHSYYVPERGVQLELHWRPFHNAHLLPADETQRLFERRQPITIAGREVHVLSDADAILYLCLHGAKHNWLCLKWLCDVAAFLERVPDVDWPVLAGHARSLRLNRAVAQGVVLAHMVLRTHLPQPVGMLAREDEAVAALVRHSLKAMVAGRTERSRLTVARLLFSTVVYRARLKPDIRYQMCILGPLWITPLDWKAWRLPDAWFPLYYVMLPLAWLRRLLLGTRDDSRTLPPTAA